MDESDNDVDEGYDDPGLVEEETVTLTVAESFDTSASVATEHSERDALTRNTSAVRPRGLAKPAAPRTGRTCALCALLALVVAGAGAAAGFLPVHPLHVALWASSCAPAADACPDAGLACEPVMACVADLATSAEPSEVHALVRPLVVDPAWSGASAVCPTDAVTLPTLPTQRGPSSDLRGWRVVKRRFGSLDLRVVKGYQAQDMVSAKLASRLGRGNTTHPEPLSCERHPDHAARALGHIDAWQYAHSCGAREWSLFLEDDAWPHPRFDEVLQQLPAWLASHKDARVVYLGWCFSYTYGTGWIDELVDRKGFFELVRFSGAECTHAYMVHRDALAPLIAAATPFTFPQCTIDKFLQDYTSKHFPRATFGVRASDTATYAPASFAVAQETKLDFDGVVFQADPSPGSDHPRPAVT